METLDNENLKKLAKQIMFDISEQEMEELQEDFKILLEQIDLLDKIDTDGVEEMVYPFEMETVFLREDEVSNVIDQQAALANVNSVMAGHVHVPKVVK